MQSGGANHRFSNIPLIERIGMGAGLGFAFLPVSGLVAKHFKKRRALAMGIITTGTSIGGFVFSLLGSKLLYSNLGFPWTVRVSAFIVLGSCVLANLLLSDPKIRLATAEQPESIHVKDKADVAHQPEEDSRRATGGTEKPETTTMMAAAAALPKENDNEATLLDPERPGDSVKLLHKPRTMSQMLRDPAYLAIISMGFVVSLGLYFPMSAGAPSKVQVPEDQPRLTQVEFAGLRSSHSLSTKESHPVWQTGCCRCSI